MGSLLSRPKKPQFKASRHKMRDSEALRRRISLNKETLDRVLQQLGHPAAQQPAHPPTHLDQRINIDQQVYHDQQAYHNQKVYLDNQVYLDQHVYQKRAPSPNTTTPYYTRKEQAQEATTATTGIGLGIAAPAPFLLPVRQAQAQAPDLNKPLPPLPTNPTTPTSTTPPTPPTPSPTYTTRAAGTPSATHTTPPTLPSSSTPFTTLQAHLDRTHVEHHRQQTLRILESRDRHQNSDWDRDSYRDRDRDRDTGAPAPLRLLRPYGRRRLPIENILDMAFGSALGPWLIWAALWWGVAAAWFLWLVWRAVRWVGRWAFGELVGGRWGRRAVGCGRGFGGWVPGRRAWFGLRPYRTTPAARSLASWLEAAERCSLLGPGQLQPWVDGARGEQPPPQEEEVGAAGV
ncbi:hypothetical protein F5144DRAFT_658230 [Chaetomium tenue]|uniref:Uncharacterized protein n=1 Tax=Chaetomium tenue TaxID=1854479 RepID=A0ACB7P0S7_9PEZI|nr:hypothetical protein F5144DRAFT_658230 [Chaetomium globosum]